MRQARYNFYAYSEPDIENFEQAVEEFQERVPELAHGLADKIKAARQGNKLSLPVSLLYTKLQWAKSVLFVRSIGIGDAEDAGRARYSVKTTF